MSKKQLAFELILNGLLPWLVFTWLTQYRHWSEYHGLLAITVIPASVGLYEFIREKRLDAIAILSLVSILIGLAMCAATSDVRLLQVRESYLTLLIGLLFLASALVGKPVLFWMATSQAQRQGTADTLKAAWADPTMRRFFNVLTIGWGLSLVLEFAIKVWMIDHFSMAQVLAWSPVALYGVTGVTVLWTFLLGRRYRQARISAPDMQKSR